MLHTTYVVQGMYRNSIGNDIYKFFDIATHNFILQIRKYIAGEIKIHIIFSLSNSENSIIN